MMVVEEEESGEHCERAEYPRHDNGEPVDCRGHAVAQHDSDGGSLLNRRVMARRGILKFVCFVASAVILIYL